MSLHVNLDLDPASGTLRLWLVHDSSDGGRRLGHVAPDSGIVFDTKVDDGVSSHGMAPTIVIGSRFASEFMSELNDALRRYYGDASIVPLNIDQMQESLTYERGRVDMMLQALLNAGRPT